MQSCHVSSSDSMTVQLTHTLSSTQYVCNKLASRWRFARKVVACMQHVIT
jgi:hypothetical protein